MIKIINGKTILTNSIEEKNVYIDGGKIVEVTSEDKPADKVIDACGNYVSAGFIDTHVHGGGGCDFMDGGLEPMRTAAKAHLAYGTTSICPTTLACPFADLKEALLTYKELSLESGKNGLPNFIGMHFEGPNFSLGQKGAQPPEYIYPPRKNEYEELISIAEGAIAKWSFAPELEGTTEFCDALVQNNILPSIAHTDGTYEDVLRVYEHGAMCFTHLYSCMSTITRKLGYRVPGVIEAAYLLPDMWVEVIGDGSHIPPILLKMITNLRGTDRMMLVTDSMRAATMPEGPSILGRTSDGWACIVEDGIAKMPDRSCFAGSVATTNRLVRTFYKNGVTSLETAVKLVTAHPAKSLGIKNKGMLACGYDADIVIFDDDINMKKVIVGGKEI